MKMLVAYDGSNSALNALKTAVSYAKVFKAMVFVVMSLYGEHRESKEEVEKAETQLKEADALIKKEGLPSEGHLLVRSMAPGEDILRFAEEHHIDLIFIGIKHRSKVGKLLFGSNAQHVILNASCPVVSVRSSRSAGDLF
jgi:nucleotide-binding universal stress UspA family protein